MRILYGARGSGIAGVHYGNDPLRRIIVRAEEDPGPY